MASSQPQTTAHDQPRIVISYFTDEDKWRDRLVSYLGPQSDELGIWNDQIVEEVPQSDPDLRRPDPKTTNALRYARVLIILLSPNYLKSTWIVGDEAEYYLRDPSIEEGLRIIPVLVKDCSWQELPLFRTRQIVPSEGPAIAESDNERQNLIFGELARNVLQFAGATPQASYASSAPGSSAQSTVNNPSVISVTPDGIVSGPTVSNASTGDSPETEPRLTIAELAKFQTSEEVQEALRRARKLAITSTRRPAKITSTCLLFGLAEGGRGKSPYFRTPQFLWKELSGDGEEAYKKVFSDKFPNAKYPRSGAKLSLDSITGEAELVSRNVVRVFEFAAELSRQTVKPESQQAVQKKTKFSPEKAPPPGAISARHLLAALLVFNPDDGAMGATDRLSNILTDVAKLRREFVKFIASNLPNDDQRAWRRILTGTAEEDDKEERKKSEPVAELNFESIQKSKPETVSEPSPEPEPLPDDDAAFQPALAGFMTDYWGGKDLLDITPDVNALASLVSAWTIEPPLSIGLFGDWGSGKSHFMRQMRTRVDKLSRTARASKLPQNKIGYYKNIVQIEFNAWHYIEGNLWASLVDHIFANLRLSEKEKLTFVEERREELMNKLGVKKEIQAKVQEKKEQLKTKETDARIRANDFKTRRAGVSQELLTFRDELQSSVLNTLSVPIEFTDEEQKLLGRMGVRADDLKSAAGVRQEYLRAKGFWERLYAQLKLFRDDPRTARKWLLASLLVLIPVLGALIKRATPLPAVPTVLASTLSFLGAFYATAKPYGEQFQKGLTALREQDEKTERERQKRIRELENEVNELTRQSLVAEGEAKTISLQVENLQTELDGITTSKIIAEFIEDRAAASDYRRHLGLLALIRRDFEKLRDLFEQQRKEEVDGKETPDNKRINRIILYIDDLDRCPPERVVQVLQAIHLLLAFPLFVVIVGVDARWVTRSLQESYEWLRGEDEDEKDSENGKQKRVSGDSSGNGNDQGATPHDYLEKIFQIPFWLRPMDPIATSKFLDGLTQETRVDNAVAQNGGGEKKVEVTDPPAGRTNGERVKSLSDSQVNPQLSQQVLLDGQETQRPANDGEGAKLAIQSDVNNQEVTDAGLRSPVTVVGNETIVDEAKEAEKAQAHEEVESEDDQEEIDLSPKSLSLTDKEIEYMKELAPLIGRSPRAVKRFLNCYRLIKVGLRPAQLEAFIGKEGESPQYRALMILLGVITGTPTVSLYVIEELEKIPKETHATMEDFLVRLEKNEELIRQPDWTRLNDFLKAHISKRDSSRLLAALLDVRSRVSRYSFRVARTEALGQKTRLAARKKTAAPRKKAAGA